MLKVYAVCGVIWFLTVMALLFNYATDSQITFDQTGNLAELSARPQFAAELTEAIPWQNLQNAARVVHFTQQHCRCNWIAQPHIDSVQRLAGENGYQNVEVVIDSNQNIAEYVPSTPAVAVYNAAGQLSYFGPYSSGYRCSPGKGLVERFIENSVSDKYGATVISQVMGCYCPVTVTPNS